MAIVFLKSVDASNRIKARALSNLPKEVVLEVEPQSVIQVVMDNAATYVILRKLLDERFRVIFWTPCATHWIDLILGQRSGNQCQKTTKFIYNYYWVLNFMR